MTDNDSKLLLCSFQSRKTPPAAPFLPVPSPRGSSQIMTKLTGLIIGQRFQQCAVNHAENGGVRPDAERERKHGTGGEAGVLQQLAEGEAEVVEHKCYRERTPWNCSSVKPVRSVSEAWRDFPSSEKASLKW